MVPAPARLTDGLPSVGLSTSPAIAAQLGPSPAVGPGRRNRKGSLRSKSSTVASSPSTSYPSTPSRLASLAASLPPELVDLVLHLAALTVTRGKDKLALLLLSHQHRTRLAPLVYRSVALTSIAALRGFAALVRADRTVARHVHRLWIGPDDSSCDLITACSPPSRSESWSITELREEAHAATHAVLRSCRRIRDLALSGELLSFAVAHSYGSACQPRFLTSINPHSFVGGFSAPIFRKVRWLRIVDTNLAFEEADEIRTLSDLEWLIWASPKDYGDISRDTNVLRRLLQRPRHHSLPSTSTSTTATTAATSATATGTNTPGEPVELVDTLWTDLSSLELTEGLMPALPSKNDRFQRLTISTAAARCREYTALLQDSYPFLSTACDDESAPAPAMGPGPATEGVARKWDRLEEAETVLSSGREPPSSRTDAHLQPQLRDGLKLPSIQPTVLEPLVLDEWDALRDLINQAAGAYSNLSLFDGDGNGGSVVVDAGNALRRQRAMWDAGKWL